MLSFTRLACAAVMAVPLALAAFLASHPAQAQTAFPDRYVGDLGGAAFLKTGVVRGQHTSTLALPYVYGDYGRFFGRIDTFGVKTLAMGWGHLELINLFWLVKTYLILFIFISGHWCQHL